MSSTSVILFTMVSSSNVSTLSRISYLTRVDAEPEGDTRFPEIDEAKWQCVDRRPHPSDEHHVHCFAFETWDRVI